MDEKVYKVIELVGTSPDSWERAAAAAVETASRNLRDLRIAEISELDMQLEDGKIHIEQWIRTITVRIPNLNRMFPTQIPGIFNGNSGLSHFCAKIVVTNNIGLWLVIQG